MKDRLPGARVLSEAWRGTLLTAEILVRVGSRLDRIVLERESGGRREGARKESDRRVAHGKLEEIRRSGAVRTT